MDTVGYAIKKKTCRQTRFGSMRQAQNWAILVRYLCFVYNCETGSLLITLITNLFLFIFSNL